LRPVLPLPKVSDEHNSFEVLDLLKVRLKRTFDLYTEHKTSDFIARIEGIALTIQEACTHDTDSALANLHLDYDTPYPVVHHIEAALLTELIGKKLGVSEELRLPLVQAGLTHDIGLIDIQETLEQQRAPLSPVQRERITEHPEESERILRDIGVTDPRWLDPVRHHHERLDGTGYPDARSGDELSTPTRILSIADIYSAMVRDRPYRRAMISGDAMRKMLLEQGAQTDKRLIHMLVKEIGVFPPGAIVRLASGEIAVVKKRTENITNPIVCVFRRENGMPTLRTAQRDTTDPEFRIQGMVSFTDYRGSIAVLRNLWN
jgi:HD-GYP domain-containing protein (c-di-GMP phosphodiesterase class II)